MRHQLRLSTIRRRSVAAIVVAVAAVSACARTRETAPAVPSTTTSTVAVVSGSTAPAGTDAFPPPAAPSRVVAALGRRAISLRSDGHYLYAGARPFVLARVDPVSGAVDEVPFGREVGIGGFYFGNTVLDDQVFLHVGPLGQPQRLLAPDSNGGPLSSIVLRDGGHVITSPFNHERLFVSSVDEPSVAELDADDGRLGPVVTVDVDGGISAPLYAAGAVWVAATDAGSVLRLDPDTLAVTDRVTVATQPTSITLAGGDLWVGHEGARLTRMEPATGRVLGEIDLLDGATGVSSIAEVVVVDVGARAFARLVLRSGSDSYGVLAEIDLGANRRGTWRTVDTLVPSVASVNGHLYALDDHGRIVEIDVDAFGGDAGAFIPDAPFTYRAGRRSRPWRTRSPPPTDGTPPRLRRQRRTTPPPSKARSRRAQKRPVVPGSPRCDRPRS